MNITHSIKITSIVILLVLSNACATHVSRLASDSTTDLSGNWNDTDARLVAKEMVQDSLSRPWFTAFSRKYQTSPTVIVGQINNLSHEHINTQTFINDIQRELINSGQVDFVASKEERNEIREERLAQDGYASEATRKEPGYEKGADFMLKGSINTIVDVASSTEQVKFYQIDLTLINLTTNRKVWIGQKKIKKAVEKNSFRF